MFNKTQTCVVFGYFKSRDLTDEKVYYIFENALVGKDHHFKNANELIDSVKSLHRKHSHDWAITNVVIA